MNKICHGFNDPWLFCGNTRQGLMEKYSSALKNSVAEGKEKDFLRFHHLDESEHFIRPLIGIMFFIIRHFVIGLKILAPKLIDLKSALVHIEVYVALFKIRRAGLPPKRQFQGAEPQ